MVGVEEGEEDLVGEGNTLTPATHGRFPLSLKGRGHCWRERGYGKGLKPLVWWNGGCGRGVPPLAQSAQETR